MGIRSRNPRTVVLTGQEEAWDQTASIYDVIGRKLLDLPKIVLNDTPLWMLYAPHRSYW